MNPVTGIQAAWGWRERRCSSYANIAVTVMKILAVVFVIGVFYVTGIV